MKKVLIAAALGLLTVSMNAGAFTWVGPVTIAGYFSFDSGSTYIRTSGTHQNPDNCAQSNYLALDHTGAGFKQLYAAIISAQAAGSTVSINYDGCLGPYPKIISVAVPIVW